MLAAHVAQSLNIRHAEVLQYVPTAGFPEYGVKFSVDGDSIKFDWLGVTLIAEARMVSHPENFLILEYPFVRVIGDVKKHVCSLFMDVEGTLFTDASCGKRIRGALRYGSDAVQLIAVSLLESSEMQPMTTST